MTGNAWAIAIAALAMLAPAVGSAETPVERGGYLVNSVMACAVCHTPLGPSGPLLDKQFSGGTVVFDAPSYTVRGSNITADPDTGIGGWSDAQVKRALTEGIRPDGRRLAPIMPYAFYRVLTARDLDAIVAYLRTVPAVRSDLPIPVIKGPLTVIAVPGADKPMDEGSLGDPVRLGFYLTNLGHCMACHARRSDGGLDFKDGLGRGGYLMKGPWGSVFVRNITTHKTLGISGWNDDEVKRAMTHGVAPDGRVLKPPMARASYYSRMTAQDIDAVVVYLRTLPPLD